MRAACILQSVGGAGGLNITLICLQAGYPKNPVIYHPCLGTSPLLVVEQSGLGKCPMTWEYWTSPEIVAIIDIYRPLIPNGWVMFNGDI